MLELVNKLPISLVWFIPLAAFAGSLVCTLLAMVGRGRHHGHWPAFIGLAIAAVVSILLLTMNSGGEHVRTEMGYTWLQVGDLRVDIASRLDGIGLVQLAVVCCISFLVVLYARGYMHNDPGYARFFAVFSGFVGCMAMLVLANNLIVLYAFWEGVGLCSYLLIGFWYQRPSAAKASLKAFLVNRIADTGFLAGILTLWYAIGLTDIDVPNTLGRLDFDTIFQAVPQIYQDHPAMLGWIGFLLLIGAIGKSAQFPFHVWLPDAMEGPTPVSALIHAATMVTAGVYLVARMSPLLFWTPSVLVLAGWLGAITALLAAVIAVFQTDLKRLLAYSTVSQLGYMFMALGVGFNKDLMGAAIVAAMFHLATHAFFKALLFLCAGNVMHAMGDVIDMKQFRGLKRILPWTHLLFLIGALALIGLPPLSGFWSKDGILALILSQIEDPQHGLTAMVWLSVGLLTALLTSIYTMRAYFMTFQGEQKIPKAAGDHPHEADFGMLAPLTVLAFGSIVVGPLLFFTSGLSNYIEPIPFLPTGHGEHHESWILIIGSTLLVAVGIGVAWWSSRPERAALTGTFAKFASVAANRFYLDEFFLAVLVIPVQVVSFIIAAFDDQVIDQGVRSLVQVPGYLGTRFQRLQTGIAFQYSFTLFVGVIAIVALIVFGIA